MRIREKHLRTVTVPFDRPAQRASGEQAKRRFRMDLAPNAEPTTRIAGYDAHGVDRHIENAPGQHALLGKSALTGVVQGAAAVLPLPDTGPGFQRAGCYSIVDELDLHELVCRPLGGQVIALIAVFEVNGNIGSVLRMQHDRVRASCFAQRDDCR